MKKNELKKEMRLFREYLQNQDLRMQLQLSSPIGQKISDSNKDSEAIQEDRYRQEAYEIMKEWAADFLYGEANKFKEEYGSLLEKEKEVLTRYERKISEYSSQIRYQRKEIKRTDKEIKDLKDKNKIIKTILKRASFCIGLEVSDASLKEIARKLKKMGRKKYKYALKMKKRKGKYIPASSTKDIIDAEDFREV